jgi:hypothetical protein
MFISLRLTGIVLLGSVMACNRPSEPALSSPPTQAISLPVVQVWRSPTCGCCLAWVEHLRQAGFTVNVRETDDMAAVHDSLGVPASMQACHSGTVGGYLVEGHVPAAEVKRLLAEQPALRGIAVPGMPMGSPGMETPGYPPDTYQVMGFDTTGTRPVASYRGLERL